MSFRISSYSATIFSRRDPQAAGWRYPKIACACSALNWNCVIKPSLATAGSLDAESGQSRHPASPRSFKSFENMGAGVRFLKLEDGPAADDFLPILDEAEERFRADSARLG